jgi:hypothetical protein
MQWMSNSPTAREIDRELGTLQGSYVGPGPCLSYHRYDVFFVQKWFAENLGIQQTQDELNDLAEMDKPGNMNDLEAIGQAAAAKLVRAEHF